MDFSLPQSALEIGKTIRRFVADDVEPCAREIERTGHIPERILRKGAELGLYGLGISEEYGGVGASLLVSAVAMEALSHGPGAATIMMGPSAPAAAIMLAGTEEQKSRFLPGLATGQMLAAFCLTEAGAGSDAAAIQTRAVRRGDRWLINGSKLYISRARYAGLFLVSTITDPEKSANSGMTVFTFEKRPGVGIGKTDEQLGLRGSGSAEVNFQDCEVTEADVLGEVGGGFGILRLVLARARLWAAARAVGSIARCLEMSNEFTQHREQFGQKLGEFQGVKFKLADIAVDLAAARMLTYHAAGLLDRGVDARHEAAVAKLFATEAAGRAADMAVQLHGAMGVSRDYPVERFYRDVRAYRILDGVSDIQRLVIARGVQRRGLGTAVVPGGSA